MKVQKLLIPAIATLLSSTPALAMIDEATAESAQNSVGPSIPEPGALLLFAAGAAVVFWSLRRRRATS